ncbi:CPBP family intramembrane glutamic endopeptidase [Acaryochloris sp. CCMEE 5410]|uniref:CPBP family intramembrane glutamic endopeptidase n=1 Tax=Acaryochloris sp. CCMEE 5410 TaxID=310037 RepID=UPI0002DC8D1E|nr:CPBP family intramembrane glutamic endopeptidase [Acaryochloris sp. CCMEE 5410]KAI9134962.1 CPBP family intramembrane metalloprotease [Acaryochloris sp. CCMEE 5410]
MLRQVVRRRLNLWALILTVPCTSIGAIMVLLVAPGRIGQTLLVIGQIWLLAVPIVWLVWVDHQPFKIPRPKPRDWRVGAIVGLMMFFTILIFYGLFARHWIDGVNVLSKSQQVVEINQQSFLLSSIYFVLINSLIEEYVWRWFIYRRCEELVPKRVAVLLAAFFFTLHHTIGLTFYVEGQMVVFGTVAVFIAGVIWSECYRRYRSIWSCYLSHAMADLAISMATWQILFS